MDRTEIKRNGDNLTFSVDMNLSLIKTGMDYVVFREMAEILAEKIAKKIYPAVLEKFLEDKSAVKKLTSEIRLLIAKKVLDERLK